jgi:hypothetical protein
MPDLTPAMKRRTVELGDELKDALDAIGHAGYPEAQRALGRRLKVLTRAAERAVYGQGRAMRDLAALATEVRALAAEITDA